MKLYYKPGACSLASHIVLREVGAKFELVRVDTAAGRTEHGEDFSAISPGGYVPALADAGETFTEGAAILQYLAATFERDDLLGNGDLSSRTRVQSHLNYIASELHRAFSPFFASSPPSGEAHNAAEAALVRRLNHVNNLLADGRQTLEGERFTVADAYLFVVASWAVPTGIGLERWPHLAAFVERIAARTPVREALRAEGLLERDAA